MFPSSLRSCLSRSPLRVNIISTIPLLWPRSFSAFHPNMSSLSIDLTAPNGVKYTQPTGLFINNEWVKSSKGNTVTSINPS